MELGGISIPRTAEFAMSAAECPLGYPAALRRGNMIEPMHESVAHPEPVMAPKTAHETVATTPSPPRMRPTKTSTTSISFSPMRPYSMMPPAMMNSAMASRTMEFIWLKP